MNTNVNPEIPFDLQKDFEKEAEQALTLYLDFVVDGTASMYTVFPAVYFAAVHFLECLTKYEVYPRLGLTVIRNEEAGETSEVMDFEGAAFTPDLNLFLKKLRTISLYGGGEDGKESVHRAIRKAIDKFPSYGRNKALLVFSDAYGSNDYDEYITSPLGQVIFFCTEEMSEEDFLFCFVRDDGSFDEEASPMYISIEKLLRPLNGEFLDNIVKPLKDLMKGVSIGA